RLPAALAVPLPAQAPADRTAARLGWTPDADAEVLTAAVHAGPADPGVLLSPALTPRWGAAYRARGVPPVGPWVLPAPDLVAVASVSEGGTAVAIGGGVVLDGWLGVAAVEVLPDHRRRGLARRVVAALTAWGAGLGARRCYVQVDAGNAPAQALYAALGFGRHHRYRIRKIPE